MLLRTPAFAWINNPQRIGGLAPISHNALLWSFKAGLDISFEALRLFSAHKRCHRWFILQNIKQCSALFVHRIFLENLSRHVHWWAQVLLVKEEKSSGWCIDNYDNFSVETFTSVHVGGWTTTNAVYVESCVPAFNRSLCYILINAM